MRKRYWIVAIVLLICTVSVNTVIFAYFIYTLPPPILEKQGSVDVVKYAENYIYITLDGKEYYGFFDSNDPPAKVGDHVKFRHIKGDYRMMNCKINGVEIDSTCYDLNMGYPALLMYLCAGFLFVGLPLIYKTLVHFFVSPRKPRYAV